MILARRPGRRMAGWRAVCALQIKSVQNSNNSKTQGRETAQSKSLLYKPEFRLPRIGVKSQGVVSPSARSQPRTATMEIAWKWSPT